MIVVAGTALLLPGNRARADELIREIVAKTRPVKGCRSYTFYISLEDENRLHVFEEWETEEDLNAHLAAHHTQEFLGAIGGLLAALPDIQRYHVTNVTGLF
jgi:quinol monooxygenase YgiN